MSHKTNDNLSETLLEAVNENAERAMFLQKKVQEKLEDLDIEGAMDLISSHSNLSGTYWEMFYRELNGDEGDEEHKENVDEHIRSEIMDDQKDE